MTSQRNPWNTPQPEDRQFSVLGLLALVAVICMALAPGRYLPPTVFAGLLGGVAVVAMTVISWLRPSGAIAYLACWCIMVLYFIAVVVAGWQITFE
jgi:hypothetical protein